MWLAPLRIARFESSHAARLPARAAGCQSHQTSVLARCSSSGAIMARAMAFLKTSAHAPYDAGVDVLLAKHRAGHRICDGRDAVNAARALLALRFGEHQVVITLDRCQADRVPAQHRVAAVVQFAADRKSTRLNSSHLG